MDATLPEPIAALSEALFRRKVEISIVISDIQQGRRARGPAAFLLVWLCLRNKGEHMRHGVPSGRSGWGAGPVPAGPLRLPGRVGQKFLKVSGFRGHAQLPNHAPSFFLNVSAEFMVLFGKVASIHCRQSETVLQNTPGPRSLDRASLSPSRQSSRCPPPGSPTRSTSKRLNEDIPT